MKYEYPPSRHIQNYAPFDVTSHFFATGKADFDGREVDCDFEVVYTHNCEIIVALYLAQSDALELFWHKEVTNGATRYSLGGLIPHRHFSRLTGIDKRSEIEVTIEDGFLRSVGGSDTPHTFVANSFYRIDRRPIVVENYLYKRRYVFELTGIDFDTDMLHQREFSISDDVPPLILEVIYKQKRQYNNQPLVRLLVPKQSVPDAWTPESLVDLWAALMSLAIGRDVRWIETEDPTEERITAKWVYRNNVMGMGTFTGLIALHPFDFDSASTIHFVEHCFRFIQSGTIPSNLAKQYTLAIRHYVTYRLLGHRAEDEARLIATTVEELLTAWENAQELEPETIATDDEVASILATAKTELYPLVNSFSGNARRRTRIKKKIAYFLRRDLPHFGFEDRLERYFAWVEQEMPTGWYAANVGERLPHFVKTRDFVVHIGKFPSEDQKVIQWYYYNTEMMLPLMVFALFRYDGKYLDLTAYWAEVCKMPEVSALENEINEGN